MLHLKNWPINRSEHTAKPWKLLTVRINLTSRIEITDIAVPYDVNSQHDSTFTDILEHAKSDIINKQR